MLRYKLRTLMIVLALGPMVLSWALVLYPPTKNIVRFYEQRLLRAMFSR
jgi:hypothetical protein